LQVALDNPAGNTPTHEVPSPGNGILAHVIVAVGVAGTGIIEVDGWTCPAGIKDGAVTGMKEPSHDQLLRYGSKKQKKHR
jgi:hypothetical protein